MPSSTQSLKGEALEIKLDAILVPTSLPLTKHSRETTYTEQIEITDS